MNPPDTASLPDPPVALVKAAHAAPTVLANTPPLADPWADLRQHTNARIALGRVGTSLPAAEVLRFGAAHAMARDAIHTPLDTAALAAQLAEDGWHTLDAQSQHAPATNTCCDPTWAAGSTLHHCKPCRSPT